jgi:hypothetical protein
LTDFQKYALKACHKINGHLFESTPINDRMTEFVIVKGSKTKRYIRFIAFDPDIIRHLATLQPKARLKIKFKVNSKTYTTGNNIKRWSTDLIAMEILDWKKNETKIYKAEKKQEQQDDSNYQKSLFTGDTGQWTK